MVQSPNILVNDVEDADLAISLGRFSSTDHRIFSINANTNWLELDKLKSYNFFKSLGIDVPSYQTYEPKTYEYPYVVKIISPSTHGPQTVIVKSDEDISLLNDSFKSYGQNALVQKYISGREFTVTVLVGNHNWVTVGVAQDFKSLSENSHVNTYGMGSISPVESHGDVHSIIDRVINGMKKNGIPYKGFLSFQFIENEKLWLLECNIRLCMPEFQSMSKLIDSSSLFEALLNAHLGNEIPSLVFNDNNSVSVNLVHRDFPYGKRLNLDFPKTHMEVIHDSSDGSWCNNTFIAGVNNFGSKSFSELSFEIYDYLDSIKTDECFYRKIV